MASDRRPHVLLGGILVLGAVVIAVMGRGVSLIGDQWSWIFDALHPHVGHVFQNYNGHLIASTYALYDVLVRISLSELWLYRAVALVLHLVVAYLVFCLARRRLGPSLALVPCLCVLLLGTGADAYLSGLNYNELIATAAALGALLTIERRTQKGDVATAALLVLSLASFSNALAFAGGIGVEILLGRERRLRRLWIPLVPLALYAAWRIRWGSSSDVSPAGPLAVLENSYKAATGAFAGLAGVQLENFTLKAHAPWLSAVAQVVFAVLIAGTCMSLAIRRRGLNARLANLVATGIVLWVLIGLGRGSAQDVYASRYVYQGAVVALLIVVELAAAYKIPARTHQRLIAIAIAATVALNIGWMAVWGRHLRHVSEVTRAQLAGLEIARDAVRPSFRPEDEFPLAPLTAGEYFATVRTFGRSPAYTLPELRRASGASRQAADEVLIRAFSLRPTDPDSPASNDPPARVEHVSSGQLRRSGRCLTLSPGRDPAGVVELAVKSPSGVTLERAGGSLDIRVRRFGDRYQPLGARAGDLRHARLRTPLGHGPDPWHLQVTSSARTTICS